MARALEFRIDGQTWKAAIEKVDRTALYGTVDVETRDKSGAWCEVATLAADGRTLIPSGADELGGELARTQTFKAIGFTPKVVRRCDDVSLLFQRRQVQHNTLRCPHIEVLLRGAYDLTAHHTLA